MADDRHTTAYQRWVAQFYPGELPSHDAQASPRESAAPSAAAESNAVANDPAVRVP